MHRIRITYLAVNGRYRTRWGSIDPAFPTVILNRRDRMRHLTVENPIWTETRPVRFPTFPEFASARPPRMPPGGGGVQRVLCEEGYLFPVRRSSRPDLKLRHRNRTATFEQAKQHARNRASADRLRGLMTLGFAAVVGVVALLTTLMAVVVLESRVG